jgi:hypothetical protein
MSMHTPGSPGRGDVSVKVHDGRKNRNPDLIDPKTGLGELLVQFMAAVPFRVGDQVALPDGTRWPAATVSDRMTLSGAWSQVISIGDA